MNWLRNKMYGRYGSDQLNMALIIIAIAISIVSMFIPIPYFSFVGFIPIVYAFYRMFSKNIARRQQENYKFLKFWYGIKNFFKGIPQRIKDGRIYKYYSCPNCKQKLRVPRGKGKVNVTCPKCKTTFTKMS